MADEESNDLEDRLARLAARRGAPNAAPRASTSGDAPTANLDDRVARLAERRASASMRTPTATRIAPGATTRRKRRPHAAAASRIFVAGLASSVFLTILATLGAAAQATANKTASSAAAAPPHRIPTAKHSTPTTIVVKVRHHRVAVTRSGQLGAATIPPRATASQSWTPPRAGAGSGSPAPATSPAPAPSAASAPKPAPTPITAAPPPPPPPPPACTGSKCP